MSDTILSERDRLRDVMFTKRKSLSVSYRMRAPQAVITQFIQAITLPPQTVVAGYYPHRNELNVLPLLKLLAAQGHSIALPVVTRLNQPLLFRAWDLASDLDRDLVKMPVPFDSAPEVLPQVVLVPAVALTMTGDRLGTGGGYYDRTLAALRKQVPDLLAIGIGYDIQLYKFIPTQPHDQPMDWVVTDKRAHYCH